MDEQYEGGDVFSHPTQLPSLDHSSAWDFHPELGNEFRQNDFYDPISFLDRMFMNEPLFTSYVPNYSTLIPEGFDNYQQQQLQMGSNSTAKMLTYEQQRQMLVENDDVSEIGSKKLSRETISNYFYMPITQAAKKMKVGLTLLKKRCRELGIRRWPHRKLTSLQTLIKNVQEMGGEDMREALQILEQEKKLMEELPDLELETKTKSLRQACFKANYKKRRLMGNGSNNNCRQFASTSSSCSSSSNQIIVQENIQNYEDDCDDEFQSLLSDFAFSSDDSRSSGIF